MSSFWSTWVMVLIVFNLGLTLALFLWAPRAKVPTLADGTTGHVWAHGVLREGMHALPRWWIVISLAMFILAFAYLVLYPGFGALPGRLGWTAHGELARDTAANDALRGPALQRFARTPIEQLATDPQALALGHVLFADNCAACHGSKARGNVLLGAPDLADGDWLYGGDGQAIVTSILDGRQGVMPPWGAAFDQAGITNLAVYVASLSLPPRNADAILKAAAGKKLFGACAACHGADGKGNAALGAPDLTDRVWLHGQTQAAIEDTIRNGRNGHMPPWRERLGVEQVHVLAAYVYSLSHSAAPAAR